MIDDNAILMSDQNTDGVTVVICPNHWHPARPSDLFNDGTTGFIATYMITFHPQGGICDNGGCRPIEKLW